jgi:hypothetical protein
VKKSVNKDGTTVVEWCGKKMFIRKEVSSKVFTFQRFITLFWVAFSIFIFSYSYQLGLGQPLAPGPGLMPFLLGIVMCGLAIIKVVSDFRSSRQAGTTSTVAQPTGITRRVITLISVVTASLFAYALLLEPLGYLITTFLVMAFLLRAAGFTQWLRILPYAAIIALVSYYGFTYLGTNFPVGILSLTGLF